MLTYFAPERRRSNREGAGWLPLAALTLLWLWPEFLGYGPQAAGDAFTKAALAAAAALGGSWFPAVYGFPYVADAPAFARTAVFLGNLAQWLGWPFYAGAKWAGALFALLGAFMCAALAGRLRGSQGFGSAFALALACPGVFVSAHALTGDAAVFAAFSLFAAGTAGVGGTTGSAAIMAAGLALGASTWGWFAAAFMGAFWALWALGAAALGARRGVAPSILSALGAAAMFLPLAAAWFGALSERPQWRDAWVAQNAWGPLGPGAGGSGFSPALAAAYALAALAPAAAAAALAAGGAVRAAKEAARRRSRAAQIAEQTERETERVMRLRRAGAAGGEAQDNFRGKKRGLRGFARSGPDAGDDAFALRALASPSASPYARRLDALGAAPCAARAFSPVSGPSGMPSRPAPGPDGRAEAGLSGSARFRRSFPRSSDRVRAAARDEAAARTRRETERLSDRSGLAPDVFCALWLALSAVFLGAQADPDPMASVVAAPALLAWGSRGLALRAGRSALALKAASGALCAAALACAGALALGRVVPRLGAAFGFAEAWLDVPAALALTICAALAAACLALGARTLRQAGAMPLLWAASFLTLSLASWNDASRGGSSLAGSVAASVFDATLPDDVAAALDARRDCVASDDLGVLVAWNANSGRAVFSLRELVNARVCAYRLAAMDAVGAEAKEPAGAVWARREGDKIYVLRAVDRADESSAQSTASSTISVKSLYDSFKELHAPAPSPRFAKKKDNGIGAGPSGRAQRKPAPGPASAPGSSLRVPKSAGSADLSRDSAASGSGATSDAFGGSAGAKGAGADPRLNPNFGALFGARRSSAPTHREGRLDAPSGAPSAAPGRRKGETTGTPSTGLAKGSAGNGASAPAPGETGSPSLSGSSSGPSPSPSPSSASDLRWKTGIYPPGGILRPQQGAIPGRKAKGAAAGAAKTWGEEEAERGRAWFVPSYNFEPAPSPNPKPGPNPNSKPGSALKPDPASGASGGAPGHGPAHPRAAPSAERPGFKGK